MKKTIYFCSIKTVSAENIIIFRYSKFRRMIPNAKNIKVFKSGLNFLEGIANWIGIKNPQLTQTEDLFSNESDKMTLDCKKRIDEKIS